MKKRERESYNEFYVKGMLEKWFIKDASIKNMRRRMGARDNR